MTLQLGASALSPISYETIKEKAFFLVLKLEAGGHHVDDYLFWNI